MSHITKLAAIETTTAIWEYDPSEPNNSVLGGGLDVVATIHTLAIKVCDLDSRFQHSDNTGVIDTRFGPANSKIQIPPV
jgi:hypothetical protein